MLSVFRSRCAIHTSGISYPDERPDRLFAKAGLFAIRKTNPQTLIAVAASISRIVAMRSIRRDLVGYRQDAVAIVVAQLAQPFGEVRDSFWIRFLFQGNAAHDFAKRETHSDDAVASRGSRPSVGLFTHAMVRNQLQNVQLWSCHPQFY